MNKHSRRVKALLEDMASELGCTLLIQHEKSGNHSQFYLKRNGHVLNSWFTGNCNCNDGTNQLNAIRRLINKTVREGKL